LYQGPNPENRDNDEGLLKKSLLKVQLILVPEKSSDGDDLQQCQNVIVSPPRAQHSYVGPHLLWVGAIFKDRMAKPTKFELHKPVKFYFILISKTNSCFSVAGNTV